MKKAIELNPKNAAALNYLGYTWAEMGERLDEAEDLIVRAIKISRPMTASLSIVWAGSTIRRAIT